MISIYKITHKETGKCYIGQAQDVQREEIKALYATGEYTQAAIGNLYGISQIQISNIIRGR